MSSEKRLLESNTVTSGDGGEGGGRDVQISSEGGDSDVSGGSGIKSDCGEGVTSDKIEPGVSSEGGEGVTSGDGGGVTVSEGGDASSSEAEGDRVSRLMTVVKQYRDVLYMEEDISKYVPEDLLKVARQCWQQVHSKVGETVEETHKKIFKEFQAFDKLRKLDQLKLQYDPSKPAWRPTGIAEEDHKTMAGVEAEKSLIQEYEKRYTEVKALTDELQQLLKEKQQELEQVKQQTRTKLEQLNTSRTDNTVSEVEVSNE